jgi:hypothetical protein
LSEDTRRWAGEANTLDCVEGDALIQMPSGETMVDVKVSVDRDTYERLLAGRLCANCFEPQEEAFPERCEATRLPNGETRCGYPIRDRQLYDMQHRTGAGEQVHVGSRIKRADEIERLLQMDEFEQRTGIVIPNREKFPNEIRESER